MSTAKAPAALSDRICEKYKFGVTDISDKVFSFHFVKKMNHYQNYSQSLSHLILRSSQNFKSK